VAVIFAAAVAAAALDFPSLSGRVVDEAGLLTTAERQSLEATLAQHEQDTTNQVVVVTLASLRGVSIEEYGYQLGRHWGIGRKEKNNGALLIVAPKERKVRIEVGYGLEGELTDAISRLIIERVILPAFRSGQFGPGIVAGTGAILKALTGEAPAAAKARRVEQRQDEASPLAFFAMLFLSVLVLFLLQYGGLFTSGRRRRGRRGRWDGGGGWGGGSGWGGGGGGGFGGGGSSGSW
jgi:uncharacterized protein